MVFSTNSDLFYTSLQYKSEKSHGLFGLGWKNQEHTVKSDEKKDLPGFGTFRFTCIHLQVGTAGLGLETAAAAAKSAGYDDGLKSCTPAEPLIDLRL